MSKSLKLIIESLLFASDKPLSAKDILTLLPSEDLNRLKKAIQELRTDYDTMGRSFLLKEVAEGYQFRTRSEYATYILQMLKSSPTRLSRAALETLAIIAYKQPILRQEIERLRGVDVGGILRMLLEKGLIRIMGRKSLPGKPLIYGTTKKFLEVFDLKDIQSLPKLKEIEDFGPDEAQAATITGKRSEIEEAQNQDDEIPPSPLEGEPLRTPPDPDAAIESDRGPDTPEN